MVDSRLAGSQSAPVVLVGEVCVARNDSLVFYILAHMFPVVSSTYMQVSTRQVHWGPVAVDSHGGRH